MASLAFIPLLVACRPRFENLPTATPQPTPQVVRVAVSPTLHPARGAFQACAQAYPGAALVLEEVPDQLLDVGRFDLVLTLGEPQQSGTFLTPIAREQILIIAQEDIPITSVSSGDLRALFGREARTWGEFFGPQASFDMEVKVFSYTPENPLRLQFEASVPGLSQPGAPGLFLAPDPAAMLEAVAGTPGAIGYLPRAWLDDSVASLPVPADMESALTLPLLIAATGPPTGAAGDLVRCLQGPAGQGPLAAFYLPLEE